METQSEYSDSHDDSLMKILHFSYAYIKSYKEPEAWLNRIEFFTPLLECMTNFAKVVAIYNIAYEGTYEQKGVQYIFAGFGRKALQWPFRFNKYIYSFQPDVVLIQGFSPWQLFLLGRMNRGLKILVQHRAEKPFSGIKKLLQREADKYIYSYFFSSAELAEDWIASGQIQNRGKVAEVMGMSSIFQPIDKAIARRHTQIDSDLVFLWVGNLDANKNPLLAAEAFMQFGKQHPEARLLMIYQEVELEGALRSRILGFEDRISLVGSVQHGEMLYWYNTADFILSTSYYESAGLSVCEGMSCGCIPVVTNIPSFRMMTDRGNVGLLFEPGDKEAFLAALEKCATIDRIGKRKQVLDFFERKLSFDANVMRIMEAAK